MVEDTNGSKARHVRFAEEKEDHGSAITPVERNGEGNVAKTTLPPPPSPAPPESEELLPRRIVLKDPTTHLAVATFLMFFLLLVAFQMDDVTDINQLAEQEAAKDQTVRPRGRHGVVQERFKAKIEQAFDAEPRREESCNFYLASTSLPGSQGFGIYAGTNFEEGATVLNISKVAYSVRGAHGEPLLVSHYGFLLGHHHLLQNLHGGPLWTDAPALESGSVLKATRFIHEAEELFLHFDEHPSRVVGDGKFSFPVPADYELAQEIIRDELDYLRPFRGGRARTAKPDEGSFRLIRKTVEKLNKHAAMMLPVSTHELLSLDLRDEPLGLAAMRNKTMEWLRRFGQCLDDAELRESEDTVSMYAKRKFNFGDVVVPLPLYATTSDSTCAPASGADDESQECSVWQQSFYKHCFGHNATTLLLCPLSSAILAAPSDDANVVLRWSSWNSQNKESQKYSPEQVVKAFSQSLTWDLVAVREIETGEEVKMRIEKGSNNFAGHIPKDLLPATWRNVN